MTDKIFDKITDDHNQFEHYLNGDFPDNYTIKYNSEKGGLLFNLETLNLFTAKVNNWNIEVDEMEEPNPSLKIKNISVFVTLEYKSKKLKAVLVPLNSENEIVKEGPGGPGGSPYVK